MGHYASEMGDERPRSTVPTGYDNEEILNDFYGGKAPAGGGDCPRCGAQVKWNWMNVESLLLHIQWHKNLIMAVRGVFYAGMVI